MKITEGATGGVQRKNMFLLANFTGKPLCCNFFLIKQSVSCKYLEISKNTCFEVETLENEIYSRKFTKKKKVFESIYGQWSLSILLYSGIKRKHWTEMK